MKDRDAPAATIHPQNIETATGTRPQTLRTPETLDDISPRVSRELARNPEDTARFIIGHIPIAVSFILTAVR